MSDHLTLSDLSEYLVATVHHFANAFFLGVLPLLVLSMIAWAAASAVRTADDTPPAEGDATDATKGRRRYSAEEKSFVTAFATLGALIGVFLGASRVGVMGAVLPAVITLTAGYLTYLFTTDSKIINRHVIPTCLLALIFSSSAGAFYGSSVRGLEREHERDWEKHLIEFSEIEVPLEKLRIEHLLRQHLESIGTPLAADSETNDGQEEATDDD